jgi:hypothetical protein
MGRPPKLTPHQQREAIKRRERGEALTEDWPHLQRQRGDDFEARAVTGPTWGDTDALPSDIREQKPQ